MLGKYPDIKYQIVCVLSACAILFGLTSCSPKPDEDLVKCAQTAEILRNSPILIPQLPYGEYPEEPPLPPVIDDPADGSLVEDSRQIVFHMQEDSPGAHLMGGADVIYGGYLAIANVDDPENALFERWVEGSTDPVKYQWMPHSTGVYVIMALAEWEYHSFVGTWQDGNYSDTFVCVKVTGVLPSALQVQPELVGPPIPVLITPSITATNTAITTNTATPTTSPFPTLTLTPTQTSTLIPPRLTPTSTSTFTPEPPPPASCSAYPDQRSCEAHNECKWVVPPTGGPGSCQNK